MRRPVIPAVVTALAVTAVLCVAPSATGSAVSATPPDPLTAEEVEAAYREHLAASGVAVTDVNCLPVGASFVCTATTINDTTIGSPVTIVDGEPQFSTVAPRSMTDGLYTIGTGVAPGIYGITDAPSNCSFERLDDDEDVLGYSFGGGRVLVELLATDSFFRSSNCGDWMPMDLDSLPPVSAANRTAIPDGVWLVRRDVLPGLYASDADFVCYWERLSTLTYAAGSTPGLGGGGGRQIVEIRAGDLAFKTTGCGAWTPFVEPTSGTPTSAFGEGVQLVGIDVVAGRYRADGGPNCNWRRLSGYGGSNRDDIIASDSPDGGQVVIDVDADDRAVWAFGCGDFSQYTPPPAPLATIDDGVYVVDNGRGSGGDIVAGTYETAVAADSQCRWARLSAFDGESPSDIESVRPDSGGSAVAVIGPTDAGFSTYGCGTWTRRA